MGDPIDNGLWLCGLHTKMQQHCVIYSFTDNNDLTFESAVMQVRVGVFVIMM